MVVDRPVASLGDSPRPTAKKLSASRRRRDASTSRLWLTRRWRRRWWRRPGGVIVHALGQPVQLGGRGSEGLRTVATDVGHDLIVDVVDEAAKVFLDASSGFVQALLPGSFWAVGSSKAIRVPLFLLIMRMRKMHGQPRLQVFAATVPMW